MKIAVCVSGGGTNLQAIIDAIDNGTITNTQIEVVISNNADAYALERAKKAGIKAVCISPKSYESRAAFNEDFLKQLNSYHVDLVVLAGFLVVIPPEMIKQYRNKIINNLTAVIQSIIAMDTTGTDVLKLQEQIKKIEGKRANLIDLYMSNLINKDEFTATRASCDAEIEELQSIIESVDKQREMIEQQQQLLKEIEDAIKEIVSGVEYEDEFYKHILDKMVVQDKDNIDVYLNLLPMKWSYTVAKASKKAVASEWNISEASLPMSVKSPFSSGYGMA